MDKKIGQKSSDKNDTNPWINCFSILTNWKNLTEPDKEINRCPTLSKFALTQHFFVLHFHAITWPTVANATTLYGKVLIEKPNFPTIKIHRIFQLQFDKKFLLFHLKIHAIN